MTPVERTSLTKTLDQRYATQRAGGAFDVKKILGDPETQPASGLTINAISMQSNEFQSPNGFEVKVKAEDTQMKDAQGTTSKELSRYMKGFNNKKYKQ